MELEDTISIKCILKNHQHRITLDCTASSFSFQRCACWHVDVYKSCFGFQTCFQGRVHRQDLCSEFLPPKVLHKQSIKSLAYRGLQSGLCLMSLSSPSSSLLVWALGSPQVFLWKRTKVGTPLNISFNEDNPTSVWFTGEKKSLTSTDKILTHHSQKKMVWVIEMSWAQI